MNLAETKLVDECYQDFFRFFDALEGMGGVKSHVVGDYEIYSTKLAHPLFNSVVALKEGIEFDKSSIDEVRAYTQTLEVPFVWYVAERLDNKEIAEANGLTAIPKAESKYVDLNTHSVEKAAIPGLEIERVTTEEDFKVFDSIASKGFEYPDGYAREFMTSQILDSENVILFLAKYEGKPVGTSLIFMKDGVGSLWFDSVLEDYRGKGIATAMVLNRVRYAMAHGVKHLYAHCVPSSVNLYNRLQFKQVADLSIYLG